MTEKLLQFIWKHRYFNQQGLELTTGEPLTIEYPGEENANQGPDFINARIRIRKHQWIGHVELHLFSSGWEKHSHTEDRNYRNVILHVVWKQDKSVISTGIFRSLNFATASPVSCLKLIPAGCLIPLLFPAN